MLPLTISASICAPLLLTPPLLASLDRRLQINDSLPPYSVSLYLRSIPASYISSPYLSPCALYLPHDTTGRGSFAGFPPTFVVAGEAERLRDEIRELVVRLKEAEGSVMVGYEETYGVSRVRRPSLRPTSLFRACSRALTPLSCFSSPRLCFLCLGVRLRPCTTSPFSLSNAPK